MRPGYAPLIRKIDALETQKCQKRARKRQERTGPCPFPTAALNGYPHSTSTVRLVSPTLVIRLPTYLHSTDTTSLNSKPSTAAGCVQTSTVPTTVQYCITTSLASFGFRMPCTQSIIQKPNQSRVWHPNRVLLSSRCHQGRLPYPWPLFDELYLILQRTNIKGKYRGIFQTPRPCRSERLNPFPSLDDYPWIVVEGAEARHVS